MQAKISSRCLQRMLFVVTRACPKKYGVLVSEDLANRLFGNVDDAIGKTVEIRWQMSNHLHEVTGVYRLPSNAVEQYDILMECRGAV